MSCQFISSGRVPRGPSVVTGSFVCGCERTFVALVIWKDIRNIVMINPLHQNNLSFAVDVADFFVERRISQGTSITAQLGLCHWYSSLDLRPCYCLQTGRLCVCVHTVIHFYHACSNLQAVQKEDRKNTHVHFNSMHHSSILCTYLNERVWRYCYKKKNVIG